MGRAFESSASPFIDFAAPSGRSTVPVPHGGNPFPARVPLARQSDGGHRSDFLRGGAWRLALLHLKIGPCSSRSLARSQSGISYSMSCASEFSVASAKKELKCPSRNGTFACI